MRKMHMLAMAASFLITGLSAAFVIQKDQQASAAPDLAPSMRACYEAENPHPCLGALAKELVATTNYPDYLIALEQQQSQPDVYARCHELTHFLGREAFLKQRAVAPLFSYSTSVCHGGFYHGVIESYFYALGIDWINQKEAVSSHLSKVCGQQGDYSTPHYFFECVHGIGHAMMFITSNELPESLAFCDVLGNRAEEEACYGGALMENSSTSTGEQHNTKYIKAEEPLYPCTILAEHYLASCYRYQSSYFGRLAGYDWQKTADYCDMVPEAYRQGCYEIIGSNQVGWNGDLSRMQASCTGLRQSQYHHICINGILSATAGRFVGDAGKLSAVCLGLPGGLTESCWRSAGGAASSWDTSGHGRTEVCSKAEARYREACLGKA